MGPWAIFLPHDMGQRERFGSKNHEARIAILFDFLSNLQQVLTCIIYIYIYKYYLILNIIYIYVFRGLKIMSLFFCGGDHVHFISAGSFSHVPRLRRRQFRPRKAGSNRRCGWEHRKHRTPNFPADRGFPLFKPFHVVSLQCHQLEK